MALKILKKLFLRNNTSWAGRRTWCCDLLCTGGIEMWCL